MELTKQQEAAMKMLKDFLFSKEEQVFILKGYAGTGKTYLISRFVDYLLEQKIQPQMMAPTGRAAKVLSNVLPRGLGATTIHRVIYELDHIIMEPAGPFDDFRKLHFGIRELTGGVNVLIIDEASMVSSMAAKDELFECGTGVVLDDLLTYARPHHGGKIIFVGDPAQLPPVGDNRSAALDEAFFAGKGLGVSSYCLTDIVRQSADSYILRGATALRHLLESGEHSTFVFDRKEGEVMDMDAPSIPQRYIAEQGEKPAIICFSNKQSSIYNKEIRKLLFPDGAQICKGEKLMVVRNNYNKEHTLLNGDIITVLEASDEVVTQSAPVNTERGGKKCRETVSLQFRKIKCETEDGFVLSTYVITSLLDSERPNLSVDESKALYINLKIRAWERGIKSDRAIEELLGTDEFYNALQVKYGYAFTCHKAQGSEWDKAIIDFSGRVGLDTDSIRWKYTAISRAKRQLYCVNLPDIRPMDDLRIMPIVSGKNVLPSKIEFNETETSPFHASDAPPALANKYRSVVRNMEEDDNQYSVEGVESLQYRERYSVRTPNGGVTMVDALYKKPGIFVKYDVSNGDERLRGYFEDESNMGYKTTYTPETESLGMLRNKMVSLCEELHIALLSIESKPWQVAYFMRTSECRSAVRFNYNKNGEITYAEPASEKGNADEKLRQLVDRLKSLK